MENVDWKKMMMDAISNVLETMFFENVEFPSDEIDPPPDGVSWWQSRIELKDEETGQVTQIHLALLPGFMGNLASTMLAVDGQEVSEEDQADVMRELTNMVGGHFLGELEADKYRLGLPQASAKPELCSPKGEVLVFSSMGEVVGISWVTAGS